MTLEEKIARAQQKVRERAGERKRQYDKEIKLRSVKRKSKLKAENTEEIITEPNIEEIEAQIISEAVGKSSLKAPVHHEQELGDALEVEIYHKPSDPQSKEIIEDSKMTEVKGAEVINESILDELTTTEKEKDENQAFKENPEETSNDSTMFGTAGILENNKLSSMDENLVEHVKEEPQEHGEKPMSVDDIVETAELNSNVGKDHNVEKDSLIAQHQSESVTSEQVTEKREGFEEESHDNIDHPQTEVNEPLNKPEENVQNHSGQLEHENDIDVSVIEPQKNEEQNTDSVKITDSIIQPTEIDQRQNEVKYPGTEEVLNVDDMKESEETENMDVMLPEVIVNTESVTSDEKLKEERNVVENTADGRKSDDKDESQVYVNVNDKPQEGCDDLSSTKVDSNAENIESSDVPKIETEVQSETIIKANEVHQHNGIDTVEFPQYKDVKGGAEEKKQCLVSLADKEPEVTSEFVHTNNSDGTISEDRVLVVELADVKDDNASMPEQNTEINVSNSEVKALGNSMTVMPVEVTNEDTDRDSLSASEGDSEKPDTDQLTKDIEHSILERSKRHLENISEGLENASSTTDVGKSDNETISLGILSSMDDSALEDGNDSVGSEIKSNGKSTHYTNSSAMDLETAAVTIQKVFRTFLFKSRASTFEDSVNDDNVLTDEDNEKVSIFY